MQFSTNKEKGNSGLALAIAYFGTNGYTVSLPLNDTQDYDLVIEKDGTFKCVQVKATGHKPIGTYYAVALKSCGGTRGTVYKLVCETAVDYLFVVTADKDMYFIPISELGLKKSIYLGVQYDKYRVYL